MNNYTPGDWEMVEAPAFGPEDYEGITIESFEAGTIICNMAGGLPLIEVLANAQLIEKAPKMLEMLKKIERWTSDEVLASRGTQVERYILEEVRNMIKDVEREL